MASYIRINFTMNARCKFARHTCSADGAVAIDESQSGPHRGASRPSRLANRLRLVRHSVSKLRPRIHAEIEPLRIERRRVKKFLRKIVSGNSAVCRDVEVGREQRAKRDRHRYPQAKFGAPWQECQTNPKRSQSEKNPSKRQS